MSDGGQTHVRGQYMFASILLAFVLGVIPLLLTPTADTGQAVSSPPE